MSIESVRLGLYEKSMPKELKLEKKLMTAKGLGFDFLEMSIDETDAMISRLDMPENKLNELSLAMSRCGIRFESICLSAHRKYPLGSADDKTANYALEIGKKAVLLALKLGIRHIQLAGYDVYYEPSTTATKTRFCENLAKLVDFTSRYGVILGFETMETPFMNTAQKAMEYVKRIGSPYLGVYPDVGNIVNSGADLESDLYSAAGKIIAVHLKETKPGVFREVRFGSGHVDFRKVFRVLKPLRVNRFLVEMWATGENWENEISAAKDYLLGCMCKSPLIDE